jgi:hypothetical protein
MLFLFLISTENNAARQQVLLAIFEYKSVNLWFLGFHSQHFEEKKEIARFVQTAPVSSQ